MKKVSGNIIFLIVLAVFFLGLAPRFLLLDKVQESITELISQSLQSRVVTERMHWVWLPIPHLTLVRTDIANAQYELSLPKVMIYPTWRIILGEFRKPGKIILDRPRLLVHRSTEPAALQPGSEGWSLLPELTILIKKGSFELEAADAYREILLEDTLKLDGIRGRLTLRPREIAVDLQGSSPFSEKITLQGNVTIPRLQYRLSLDCRDLQLHKSVKSLFAGRLIPLESRARLSGNFSGQGVQQIEGELHGTLPSFSFKSQERSIPLVFGYADLEFSWSESLLRLDLHNLEMKDPQFNLSGYIERTMPTEGKEKQAQEGAPVWNINLAGTNLDLTTIRQRVLTLWGQYWTTQIVTDTVRGGKALSAAYRFTGKTRDFEDLANMVIEADVLNGSIHVPYAELDLSRASGPITIKNAILAGEGLSAQLGKSFGSNGRIVLDLNKHGHLFKLDIDLNADLEDLPPVLAHLVPNDDFQRELRKFSGVTGRATGALHLGDSIHMIITRFEVKDTQASARYEPVPHTILIDSGILEYAPGKVSWQKVKGRIGQQEIVNTAGSVSWQQGGQEEEALLHLEEIEARLDGASLLTMLQQTELTSQQVNSILSALDGTIEVTAGSVQGPLLLPESWVYDIAFTTGGLTLASPLLPEPASSQKFTAAVNQNEAAIQEAQINFLDQSFRLRGLLQHQILRNWHGTVEFNGPVKAKLAAWISGMGWFPEKLHPQIPCTMENLEVRWQGEALGVTGTILHGLEGGRLPMARIDFEDSPEHLQIKELTFYAPGEQGRLRVDFWRLSPNSLDLSWEGFVTAETIDALFRHSSFNTGNFSGAFSLSLSTDKPENTRFNGLLSAENLRLQQDSNIETIIITDLDLKGVGRQVRVPAMSLVVGSEKISGSGQVEAEKDGLQLDISLTAPSLSQKSLASLSLTLQKTGNLLLADTAAQASTPQAGWAWNLTGRIGFAFDAFTLSRLATTPYDEEQPVSYTFYDVQGDLQLAPDRISRTEIFSSKLCGLNFRGFWFSDINLGQEIQLSTDPSQAFRLENVLPCLGVQQDIIEGEFSLQASLLKEGNTWYDGNIYINSSEGRILRLKTFSRIFKVVNITDLFEKNVANTGKRGFSYSQLNIDTHIQANNLVIDRAIIRGEGLNLYTQGIVHLDDYDADLTLLIAPFKTFDTIVSKVPIIGQPLLGESGSRMAIPVTIKGPLADPVITPMHPEAITDTVFNLLRDTFMLPYNILVSPQKPGTEKNGEVSGE